MTSLTGSTKQTLKGTRDPPPYSLALFGGVFQISVILYFWVSYTSASVCLTQPAQCLFHLFSADPWGRQALLTVVFALFLWCVSGVHPTHDGYSDPSIVDRLWSIQPVVYVWHFFLVLWWQDIWSPRVALMTFLVTAWGARLTWNFWRKGGFSGGEDHRWTEVRTWYPGWKFEVFNLLFTCIYQQLLILAFTTPIVPAAQHPTVPLKDLDYITAALFALLLIGESVADAQMFNYQTEKYRRLAAGIPLGKEYSSGFIQSGLWAFSRHPNYFCEVSMWCVFYLFSVSATGAWLNWSLLGAVFLALLFLVPGASLDLSEILSSRKYLEYPDYQKRVSCFIPWIPSYKTL